MYHSISTGIWTGGCHSLLQGVWYSVDDFGTGCIKSGGGCTESVKSLLLLQNSYFYRDSEESTGTWIYLSGRWNKCVRWCRRQAGDESVAGTESTVTASYLRDHKTGTSDESEKLGLFTARKPAYACLATRIPSGTRIRAKQLQDVEQAETALTAMGFTDFRVRHPEGYAKLQVKPEQLSLVMEKREEILTVLEPIFGTVCLDLKTR